ncbi:Nif3-like dinuclear metal center hexameric protein [Mucilaginibacter sp. FT3.2]|uniref:Nif3-like dinuclear metal center hexameric protein n=1 Tax=Mucilaginibacter sp. FT3.2 TaxID=2723090 RepID=UPI001611DB98|nr:Nif3-like dinuclear metal center hexameric protein [Mucilaginibacter sp. FT3.2]MBB6231721.1 putative NIF3 family GTP cyclohydrolase 1 type 2 [Mucilaginibacter sp. FT3.2]
MHTTKNLFPINEDHSRRKFIFNLSKVAAVTALLTTPFGGRAASFFEVQDDVTVGQIIDKFISQIPGAPFPKTVDTLKAGSLDIKVTGIVTTMFATIEVIKQAIALNANFIIAHEPTFYNHADETDWLAGDDVYQYKTKLLNEHNIAVWRNHDYIHSLKPDGVGMGVLTQLNWAAYYKPQLGNVLMLPTTSLGALIEYLKTKLSINKVRYIGNPTQSCQKVVFIPGAAGGRMQITQASKIKPDVLIVGEIQEWETAEYVRDAQAKGDNLALIVLGHIASEEPGSEFMAGWLKQHFAAVKSVHIPAKNSLAFM